ncbi:MAG: hypothetical protein GF317_06635 [Candidatus Lokiarchaeota archaeon]|nr:hypothetical protein [Candidatus Lokiarchaeota archaeon]MBD3199390.1 hypothetical protein [Candidatus Lokiarchaeota archaeon]
MISLITLISNIGFMIFIFTEGSIFLLEPNYSFLDLIFVIFNILLFLFLVVFGLVKQKPSISEISPEAIRRRRREVQRISRTPARRSRSQTRPQRTQQSTSNRKRRPKPKPKTQRSKQTARSKKISKEELIKRLKSMKPKAGVLSLEDFKCIFCFQLPSLPEDKGRGIVLCPSCKHPAHADEFRDWTRNSGLCSRCDSPLPASFRRNPRIIPTRLYVKAIKYFKKKGEIQ